MSKVAVVYWSMTGNTEAMAKELASAADTEAIESSEFSADMCDQYDAFVRIVNQSIISELGEIISNNSGSAMLSIRLSDGTGRNDVELTYDQGMVAPTPILLDFCRQYGIEMTAK